MGAGPARYPRLHRTAGHLVWDEFRNMLVHDRLVFHTAITAMQVGIGFVLGVLLGVLCGFALGMSPTAEFVLSPYILALQIAPKVAFAPLFIIWFGYTVYPKILVCVLIVFFPVMINVLGACGRSIRTSCAWPNRSQPTACRSSGRSNFPPPCHPCSPASGSRPPWR